MSRLFLIHGFGMGIRGGLIKARGQDAGFEAFRKDVENGQAAVFDWRMEVRFSFWQGLNPWQYLRVYRQEKKKSEDPAVHLDLQSSLAQHQPDILICHSMGCQLLLEYLNKFNLPASIRQIVFVQANSSRHFQTANQNVLQRLQKQELVWHNYYCPWDNALLASWILHARLPAGLFGTTCPGVTNHFFPLYKRINLHMSSICDRNFRKEIANTQE